MQLQILYEDNHIIAVNKPGGLLVHGDETDDRTVSDLVKHHIKVKYQKPGAVFLGVIHRIDRPVSGVLVMARTSKALTRMNKLFQDQKVRKTYWAVTAKQPPMLEGHLMHYIAKDKTKNVARAYDQLSHRATKAKAKKSELRYRFVAKINDHHFLEVNPLTGRPHQIRVQLAKIDCPIKGDVKYGFPRANRDKNIHLHCHSITFEHPVRKETMTIEAPPPKDDIWKLFLEAVQI